MKPARTWRIGVIGCGAWGPNHVRNFSALPNADVVGAADLQPDRLARVKALVPGLATFADAAAMMAATRPDAVIVSTPTMTHFDVVRQALSSGAHVLCEKPLCLTGDEADALATLVVTKPVPDYAVVLGNPARVRGYVCECCQPLAGKGRALTCGACGLRYVKTRAGVSPAPVKVSPKPKAKADEPKPKAKADEPKPKAKR